MEKLTSQQQQSLAAYNYLLYIREKKREMRELIKERMKEKQKAKTISK